MKKRKTWKTEEPEKVSYHKGYLQGTPQILQNFAYMVVFITKKGSHCILKYVRSLSMLEILHEMCMHSLCQFHNICIIQCLV